MIVVVQATFPDADAAEKAGHGAVEARLAACCNLFGECQSVYRWRGEMEAATEAVAQFKTSPVRARRLVEWLTALHPYELPAIEWWEVAVSPAVEEWVSLETN